MPSELNKSIAEPNASPSSEGSVGDFPVVALGTSAGGLKALEAFFRNMPPDSEMAFVLAMHLSLEHESQLAQILRSFTAMPVTQVNEPLEIAPNQVYVISPGQYLTLQDNRLLVAARGTPPATGVIDYLFQSLAEDRQERAIGIVLSGSGADGALGLQAIKERGGLILAQDPTDAEYVSMPRSIIETGLVDFILPASEMPARLIALRDQAPRQVLPVVGKVWPDEEEQALQRILQRLRGKTGHDFAHFKRTALRRQLGRRMLVLHSENLPAYAHLIEEDEAEVEALFRNLLVSVTRFFRDPEAFLKLERVVLPKLIEEAIAVDDGEPANIRVWVPGCATGEEAYSLAMLLAELREAAPAPVTVQILASDIDAEALSIARRGRYPEAVTAGLSAARLKRFFVRKESDYQVSDELRAMVLFASHDVTRDPPFARIDLISCRNVLIYFEAGMQQLVLERCAYSLRPAGYLFLGTSESAGRASSLFDPVSKKFGIFQRTRSGRPSASLNFFPVARAQGPGSHPGWPGFDIPEVPAADGTATGQARRPALSENSGAEMTHDALILANQEMQSLNEELRSMMEELEVAKEEMQSLNEELITVNQELQNKIEEHRRVNADLHILIESTQLATLFLDQHLNVVLYTPESTNLFNLLPIDVGRPLEHLSHRLTYTGILDDARQVIKTGAEVEREVKAEDGNWYAMRVMPYPTDQEPAGGVVLTFADITSQKRVEQISQDRFMLAFHAGPMAASIVTRDDGHFVDVNQNFEQITGYSREEVAGLPARAFGLYFDGDHEAPSEDASDEAVLEEVEFRIRTRGGALCEIVVSTTPIEFEGKPCYLNLFYDVTERKRLEREILQVSDREQRRIGVDLHDGLGTHLTGVAMMARAFARNLRAGRTVGAEEMDDIAEQLGECIEQARTLAQGLNPFLLEVQGLTIALRELASDFETRTGISCSLEIDGNGRALSSEQSMHLYRITQEALTNAARHAQATRIQISLSRKDDRFRLVIQDDGIGFQQTRREDPREQVTGMGLSIMRYRAEMIAAKLKISSAPGKGTTITCSFRPAT